MAFAASGAGGGGGGGDDAAEVAEILARDVPWETYMTTRLISDNDLQLIRKYDKRGAGVQAGLLEEVRATGRVCRSIHI